MEDDKAGQSAHDCDDFGFTQKLKDRVRQKLAEVLEKHGRTDLLDLAYEIAVELVINASKAMMKRIVFSELGYDINDQDQWDKGTAVFKEKLREKYLHEYLKKATALNYWIKFRCVHGPDGMRMEIINNTPIPSIDDRRLRKLLCNAMRYTDLAHYYFDQADHKEGEGLGIGLIIIMLKNQGLDPKYLRIGTIQDKTVARIEMPFNPRYKPYRDLKFEFIR